MGNYEDKLEFDKEEHIIDISRKLPPNVVHPAAAHDAAVDEMEVQLQRSCRVPCCV